MEVLIEYGEEQEIMESFRGNKRTAKGYQKLLAGHVHNVGMKRTYDLTVEQVQARINWLRQMRVKDAVLNKSTPPFLARARLNYLMSPKK